MKNYKVELKIKGLNVLNSAWDEMDLSGVRDWMIYSRKIKDVQKEMEFTVRDCILKTYEEIGVLSDRNFIEDHWAKPVKRIAPNNRYYNYVYNVYDVLRENDGFVERGEISHQIEIDIEFI